MTEKYWLLERWTNGTWYEVAKFVEPTQALAVIEPLQKEFKWQYKVSEVSV